MVPGLAHVILHIGLCGTIARQPAAAPLAIRVRLSDRTGRTTFDRTLRMERGDGSEVLVELDSAFGIYRLDVAAPKHGCSTTDFLNLMADRTRSVTEQLDTLPRPPEVPVILFGDAPQTMLYANPTFVVFDKGTVACGKPIPAPLAARVSVENDQDSYYASFYNDDATRKPDTEVLALKLQTPTHQHHYVRLPIEFPLPPTNWPDAIQLNVSEDMIAGLATEQIDTLLCPKMWKTSVR